MKLIKHPEKAVLISAVVLIALGLIFIYSVSGPYSYQHKLSSWYYFLRQLIWAFIAVFVMFVLSSLDYRKYLKLSPVVIFVALTFLAALFFTASQMNVNRWLYLGFISFQPSELFKLALIMYLAFVLIDSKGKPKNLKRMIPHMGIAAMGILMIIKQPDLGTTMLVFAVTAMVFFLAGLKVRYLLAAVLAILLVGSVMVFGLGYEKDRIDDYVACLQDPLGEAQEGGLSNGYYQSRQSLISIGSGGILGRGLGGGGQKNLFLPAPHTDFIFSASAEEGGFLLCLVILGLIFTFGISSLKIAMQAADLRGFLLATGLTAMIMFQAIINIGVALGLLPITGITLPFFSYGGSSLVISCAAVGMILSVARYGGSPRPRFVRTR